MQRKKIAMLAVVWAVGLPGMAFARDEERQEKTGDPAGLDVAAILKKVDEATRAVTAVSYEASFHAEGDIADKVPRITGAVKLQQRRKTLLERLTGDSDKMHSMRIEGTVTGAQWGDGAPFKIVTRGKWICKLDLAKNVFTRGEWPHARQLLGQRGTHPLHMREYLHPTPFSDEIEAKKARHEGIVDVGGVECHTIYIVYQDNSQSRWYFGVEDHLPRRVDRIYKVGNLRGATVLILTNLNTEPTFVPKDFCLPCPEGCEKRKI